MDWAISMVTVGELEAGTLLARDAGERAERLRRLSLILRRVPVLPVDHAIASRYAELRASAGRQPSNDLWIAATALAHGLRLVTADKRQAALPLIDAVYICGDADEAAGLYVEDDEETAE